MSDDGTGMVSRETIMLASGSASRKAMLSAASRAVNCSMMARVF